MGSHTWVRDPKKAGGGRSFAVGVPAVIPQTAPPPKKRKLVWQREENEDTAKQDEARRADLAAKKSEEAAKKRQELEELKRKIEQRKAAIERSKAAATAATLEQERAEKVEREARKRKLEAGFADAFAAAKEAAAADITSSKTPITFADTKEVERVLAAGTEYGVLRLAPGADASTVRRRYREMAVQLHPDKCKAPRAGEAFHKLVKSYQQLAKYTK